MNIIGNITIHPILFYTGKIAGYIVWIIYFISILSLFSDTKQPNDEIKLLSYCISAIALLIIMISLINLGRSTRLGLPQENTIFIINGLYRYSRNPMYLGFDLLTLSAMIFSGNLFISIAGIYSIIIYHFIIIGEEKFLENRFSNKYLEYKNRVRRYF